MPAPKHRFDNQLIVDRIKRAREHAGMSRKELAGKAGFEGPPYWLYYKKEKGSVPLSLDEIERICDALPDCPSLFPFLDWDAAVLADRLLGRGSNNRDK